MGSRAEERRRQWLEAQKEKINLNGMPQNSTPLSTRTAAEVAQSQQPEPECTTPSNHSSAAGCTSVQYGGRVRDRYDITAAKKRVESEIALPPARQSTGRFDPWAALDQLGIKRN